MFLLRRPHSRLHHWRPSNSSSPKPLSRRCRALREAVAAVRKSAPPSVQMWASTKTGVVRAPTKRLAGWVRTVHRQGGRAGRALPCADEEDGEMSAAHTPMGGRCSLLSSLRRGSFSSSLLTLPPPCLLCVVAEVNSRPWSCSRMGSRSRMGGAPD